MTNETQLREQICTLAKSMFDRGLTGGASGNISARLADDGRLIGGDAPTKEMPLHSAFYDTRSQTGAVVHLHSTHSVALSMLPYFMPSDPAMGEAVRGLAGKRAAVLLANHGPVVAGKDIEAAVYAMEELEETAKLALITRGCNPQMLTAVQVNGIVDKFDVEWEA